MDGLENEIDFDNLNLDEALGGDFADELGTDNALGEQDDSAVAGSNAPPPQADTPEAEQPTEAKDNQQAQDGTEPEKPEGWNPDGPGDIKRALQIEREKARELQARIEAIEAEKAQQAAQAQQQQYERQVAERYQQLLDEGRDEEAGQLLQQYTSHQQQQAQARYQQQAIESKVNLSIQYAQRTYGEEFQKAEGFLQSLGGAVNWQAFLQADDPAGAMMEYYQRVKPVDREALKAELLAELQPQLTAKKPTGPKTLGTLPAAAGAHDDSEKTLTQADIERLGLNALDFVE